MKFEVFQKVRHLKTDSVYMVIGTPDKLILEKTTEQAYAYQKINDCTAKIWIVSKSEMEDGRFVFLEE